MAVFLFISGFTGAIISWDHELDEWLNPQFFKAQSEGEATAEPADSLVLARRLEETDPRLMVSYLPLSAEPGHALTMSIRPWRNPETDKPYDLGFNQIAIDPGNGEVQGKREWGEISLSRENLLPFLYKLHYSMHIPDGFDLELGVLLMGIIGIVWALDCLIALWISFPSWASWHKSFAFRWKQGGHKLTFDLHRSGGVWLWGFLLLLAITSVSMNLNNEVMRPLVSMVSPITASPFDTRTPQPPNRPISPLISREEAVSLAQAEALQRGWTAPPGAVFYSSAYGLYGVGFFEPGKDHGDVGLGNPWLYFDGQNGKLEGDSVPGTGSVGDIFLQAQFPLHSGRIIGIPGRIMVSLLGLVVAVASVTGVLLWARKRRARMSSVERRTIGKAGDLPLAGGSVSL